MSTNRGDFRHDAILTLTWRSCINCSYYNKEKDICEKYDQRPPAEVIVFACPTWLALIPF